MGAAILIQKSYIVSNGKPTSPPAIRRKHWPVWLHSASPVQTPNSLLPTVNVTPLKLHSPSSINLHGASNHNIFHNRLRIRLSPLKSPILPKNTIPYNRSGMYPSIANCNTKSCIWCNYLNCKTTIISTVNNRQFSVMYNSDLDWTSEDILYVLTCSEEGWGMQYVGQTKRTFKTRFGEHFRKMKNPKNSDTFLYWHFGKAGHSWSPDKILVQSVEKNHL